MDKFNQIYESLMHEATMKSVKMKTQKITIVSEIMINKKMLIKEIGDAVSIIEEGAKMYEAKGTDGKPYLKIVTGVLYGDEEKLADILEKSIPNISTVRYKYVQGSIDFTDVYSCFFKDVSIQTKIVIK